MQAAVRAKQEMTSRQEAADKAAAEKAELDDSKAKRLQKLKARHVQIRVTQC